MKSTDSSNSVYGGLALLCMIAVGVVFVVWFAVEASPQLRETVLEVFDSVAFFILVQPGVFLLAFMGQRAYDKGQTSRMRMQSAVLAGVGGLWIVGMFFLGPYLPDGGSLGAFMDSVTTAAQAADTAL